jgi:hypothetical protein
MKWCHLVVPHKGCCTALNVEAASSRFMTRHGCRVYTTRKKRAGRFSGKNKKFLTCASSRLSEVGTSQGRRKVRKVMQKAQEGGLDAGAAYLLAVLKDWAFC